jgi:hypothetical protein
MDFPSEKVQRRRARPSVPPRYENSISHEISSTSRAGTGCAAFPQPRYNEQNLKRADLNQLAGAQ